LPNEPHVVIATPCYGGQLTMAYVDSVIKLQAACIARAIRIDFDLRRGADHARAMISPRASSPAGIAHADEAISRGDRSLVVIEIHAAPTSTAMCPTSTLCSNA
jgi:hypothetical protein